MANKIILKRSNVAGKIPTISDLAVGEISLNMADRLLYYRTPEDTIQSVTIEAGGAGDMLTSVYDTNTNGIVDNAEAINGYNLQVNQNLQTTDNVVFNTITTALNAFDVTYVETGSEAQGSLYWNPDEETLNLKQNGAILQLGQELQVHCRNTSGATISNGTVVMATGSIGNSGRITVSPYSTSVEAKYIVGIATEDILNGEDGKITFDGKIRSLDTSSFSDGDILYVANGGGLTTTQPTGTLREPIAFVINSHSNGTIFVRVPTFPDSYTTTETDNLLDGKQDYDANIVSDASYVHTDNNYTTTEKNKLAGIATNANNYTHPSTHPATMITTTDEFVYSNSSNVQDVLDDLDQALQGKQASGSYVTTTDNQALHDTDALRLSANQLYLYKGDGTYESVDLSLYLDDTNLARLVSGSLNGSTGIATFTRDDASTFTVDFSALFDDTDTNDYVDSISFNTGDGVLTLGRTGALADLTVDLDGRYAYSSHSHNYVSEGGTDFSGTYPMVARIGTNNIYSNPSLTYTGSTDTLNAVNIAVSGTVDGRDVSADGAKLDGIAPDANKYVHPTYVGDDINLDTGALSGATVISDLDFNVTTDTLGHVTDANATYSTRNLTANNVGALPITGGTVTGNLTVDNGTSSTLSVKCDDSGLALIRANGDSQGTGAVEVGQSNTYGGGISYNGDNSPGFVSGETADNITFYRLSAGTRTEVFSYPYSSNTVTFNSNPKVGSNTIFHDAYHPNADKWTTSRTLSLTGDVTGSTSFDGSGNASITATVADDSHNHVIANVDGLQTALDGKVDDSQVLTNVPAGAVFTDTLYTHPSHPGDDINVDTGALSGATVISDLDFNVTTDTLGHVTDANATVSTRNLTASDIGAAPASHSHSYLPLSGGTMTGNIIMNDEYIDFKTGGNPTLPQIRGYRGSNDLNTRLLESEGGLAWTTYDSGAANKPSGTTNNANGVLSLNTHGGSYGHQLAFNNSGGFWHRSEENGSIRSWDRVFTDSYHPNADKWTTARTLSLTGDVTGSTTWDGSGNASINVDVGNASTATWADTVDVNTSTSTSTYGILWNSGDTVYTTSNAKIRPSDSAIFAPIYYDINNTAYYMNPASTSNLNDVNANEVDVSGGVKIGNEIVLQESTDRADLLQITSTTSSWAGIQLRNSSNEGRWSLMTDASLFGIYDDENNEWVTQHDENGETRLYYNGAEKFNTHNTGATVTGDLTVTGGDIVLGGTGRIQGIDTVSTSTDAVNKSYVDTAIAGVGGGATGGGSDDIFYENGQTITTSYTITTGKNAMTAGDVTLADGVTVTVPSGSRWVIV